MIEACDDVVALFDGEVLVVAESVRVTIAVFEIVSVAAAVFDRTPVAHAEFVDDAVSAAEVDALALSLAEDESRALWVVKDDADGDIETFDVTVGDVEVEKNKLDRLDMVDETHDDTKALLVADIVIPLRVCVGVVVRVAAVEGETEMILLFEPL